MQETFTNCERGIGDGSNDSITNLLSDRIGFTSMISHFDIKAD